MNAKNIFRNIRGLAMSALLLIPAAFVSCSDDDTEGGSPYFRLENTVVSSKLVTASSDLGFDAEAIIGDATHGKGALNRAVAALLGSQRLWLHAQSLVLRHPVSGAPVRVSAPVPADMLQLLQVLREDTRAWDQSQRR